MQHTENTELLEIGTMILSLDGEISDTEEYGQDTETGPMAIGVIEQIIDGQENCYSVAFPKDVSVLLSMSELMSGRYIVCHGAETAN